MICKVCGGPILKSDEPCPECGWEGESAKGRKAPSRSVTAEIPLNSSHLEAGIGEVTELVPSAVVTTKGAPAVKEGDGAERKAPGPEVEGIKQTGRARTRIKLDRVGLRRLLAENLEVLGPGLQVVGSAEAKTLPGVLAPPGGHVDLLLKGPGGDSIVCLVGPPEAAEPLIAQALQAVGWIKQHLASSGGKARALIIVDRAPASLLRAAAAVPDVIGVLEYDLSLELRTPPSPA